MTCYEVYHIHHACKSGRVESAVLDFLVCIQDLCVTIPHSVCPMQVHWPGLRGVEEFLNADRRPLYPPSGMATLNTGAFIQSYKNLVFYWILKAGHMVRDCRLICQ